MSKHSILGNIHNCRHVFVWQKERWGQDSLDLHDVIFELPFKHRKQLHFQLKLAQPKANTRWCFYLISMYKILQGGKHLNKSVKMGSHHLTERDYSREREKLDCIVTCFGKYTSWSLLKQSVFFCFFLIRFIYINCMSTFYKAE